MTKRDSSLLWSLERGLGIALQPMLEKKAVMSQKWGSLVGFLYLRRQCGVSHEVRRGAQGASRVVPGKSGLHECSRGSASLPSSHGRGIGPQNVLKKDS